MIEKDLKVLVKFGPENRNQFVLGITPIDLYNRALCTKIVFLFFLVPYLHISGHYPALLRRFARYFIRKFCVLCFLLLPVYLPII